MLIGNIQHTNLVYDLLSPFVFRMEVWFGQVDPEHAADECGAVPPKSFHHVDGAHQGGNQPPKKLDLANLFFSTYSCKFNFDG